MANSRSQLMRQADSVASAFYELAATTRTFENDRDDMNAFMVTQAFENLVSLIQGEIVQQTDSEDC